MSLSLCTATEEEIFHWEKGVEQQNKMAVQGELRVSGKLFSDDVCHDYQFLLWLKCPNYISNLALSAKGVIPRVKPCFCGFL